MSKTIETFLTLVVFLAMLFILVRPGSKGPTLVTNVTSGLRGLITAGTGGGAWSKA